MKDTERSARGRRLYFLLFGAAVAVALASAAGIVLFGLKSSYAPAAVCCALSLLAFYSAPVYLKNALCASAAMKMLAALAGGASTLDELAAATHLKSAYAKKQFQRAAALGLITSYELSGEELKARLQGKS